MWYGYEGGDRGDPNYPERLMRYVPRWWRVLGLAAAAVVMLALGPCGRVGDGMAQIVLTGMVLALMPVIPATGLYLTERWRRRSAK